MSRCAFDVSPSPFVPGPPPLAFLSPLTRRFSRCFASFHRVEALQKAENIVAGVGI